MANPKPPFAPFTNNLATNPTSSATASLCLLALEIALLCYPSNSPKISQQSKNRLRTIRQAREAQALGLDPGLFVRLLASFRTEYQTHWSVWGPFARPPSRHFDGDDDEGGFVEDGKRRWESLVRFANEVVVGEWCVADAGLDAEAVKVVVQTVEMCRALGRGVHAVEWERVLGEVRRGWCGHWVQWASVDEGGRVEYGAWEGGSGPGLLDTTAKSLLVRLRLAPVALARFPRGPSSRSSDKLSLSPMMVGRMVLTRRTENGEEEMIERGVLAERLAGEYERVRSELRGGR
ncbi:hypothetical protein PMIN06_001600 [Paraphaeosphaeria minitans]|uniref:Uncharacterized protein n=1 Tax=Paraphaeosphaeria minitans TaxID=565426 RepID=A0A9P6GRI7_9PLEO|nr:hypothetical protein PMIN01_00091 [Paraphaeosphaeria minitans]